MDNSPPKTLKEAIENGLLELTVTGNELVSPEEHLRGRTIMMNHVRKFLAQKFGRAYIDPTVSFTRLWEEINKDE